MPIRQVAILAGLLCLCLAIIGLAWATGGELYLFVPTRHGPVHPPPTPPSVILLFFAIIVAASVWIRERGIYVLAILAGGIILGSIVGRLVYNWTPSLSQHLLSVAMVAACVYAWLQKEYFEE